MTATELYHRRTLDELINSYVRHGRDYKSLVDLLKEYPQLYKAFQRNIDAYKEKIEVLKQNGKPIEEVICYGRM